VTKGSAASYVAPPSPVSSSPTHDSKRATQTSVSPASSASPLVRAPSAAAAVASVQTSSRRPPVVIDAGQASPRPRGSDGAEPQRRVSLKDPRRRGSEAYHTEGKIADSYSVGKAIGKGGFGEVRLGTRKEDGKTCVESKRSGRG
jgi:hypothetical protein